MCNRGLATSVFKHLSSRPSIIFYNVGSHFLSSDITRFKEQRGWVDVRQIGMKITQNTYILVFNIIRQKWVAELSIM